MSSSPTCRRATRRGLTDEELLALPAAVDLTTTLQAYGIGRTKGLELLKRGEFPVAPIEFGRGRAYRFRRADILRDLGIAVNGGSAA